MIDIVEQVNAVRRQVGDRTIEAGQARTVTVTRTYHAGLEDVWDACTNAERIPRWFLPVSGDLQLHGRYQLEGNAGGTVVECDPPRGFTVTWEFGGKTSWVEVRLTPEAPDRTRLQLEHIVPEDEQWAEFGPGAVGVGWDLALLGLSGHLTGEKAVDPAESMAWMASPEGRHFMTLSSQRWGEAAVAAGTDRSTAHAAAGRTTAAYTAGPEQSPAV